MRRAARIGGLVAVAAAIGVGGVALMGRNSTMGSSRAAAVAVGEAEPPAKIALAEPAAPAAATPPPIEAKVETKSAAKSEIKLEPKAELKTPPTAPASAPALPSTAKPVVPALTAPLASPVVADPGKVIDVEGSNPDKPSDVFFVSSHREAVLYKKRRDDAGEGTRIEVRRGAKIRIPIGGDEVYRVAEGNGGIDIFYQGRKLPAKYIASGAWMAFVPTGGGTQQ